MMESCTQVVMPLLLIIPLKWQQRSTKGEGITLKNVLGDSSKPRIWTDFRKTESRLDHTAAKCAEGATGQDVHRRLSGGGAPGTWRGREVRMANEGLLMGQLHPPFPYA